MSTGPAESDAPRWWIVLGVILLVGLHPFLYGGMFAGDAEIHLVYAEHAAQGHFFEFNPGEPSPGVTSPGYMLLLAVFFLVLQASSVALAVKIFTVLIWYAFIAILYLLFRRVLHDRRWALGAALIAGLLPGSAYNSVVGMENGLFGLLVALFFYLAVRWETDSPLHGSTSLQRVYLGVLLGCNCWIRPEGFIIAPIAIGYLVATRWKRGEKLSQICARLLPVLIPCGLIAVGLIYFHFIQTGHLLPSSGKSRMFVGLRNSIALGPFSFAPGFTIRLAEYFPLTILFLAGNWLVLRGRFSREDAPTFRVFLTVFWVFFVFYSIIVGSAHLARYIIFIMPYYVLVAIAAAQWLWQRRQASTNWRWSQWLLAALLIGTIAQLGVFAIEAYQRRSLGVWDEVFRAAEAPRHREELSNDLLAKLGRPSNRPVPLLSEEVQLRYWLDDRFVIRSADGRVDPVLFDYVHGHAVDLLGYIKGRNIDFVMETPDFTSGSGQFSLRRLSSLKPGETLEQDGLSFSLVCDADGKPIIFSFTGQPMYRVQRAVQTGRN